MAKKLNQLEATAICGDDISSSCLYVSALAIFYAGQYAWVSLLMVAGVLFLFLLDRAYPDVHIEFVRELGCFGPDKIRELSERWHVPINFMFIGTPGEDFPYKVQQLGEVRLIV